MKKTGFTEAQIVPILKGADAGMKVADICRKHGISAATCYHWKSKYGGMEMEVPDLKRMKELASGSMWMCCRCGCLCGTASACTGYTVPWG